VLVYLCTPIFQAEGASTEQALSSALTSIMDALKSTDWNTRKAASLALSSIAVSSGYLVTYFRLCFIDLMPPMIGKTGT
jgi:hypothetical protein